MERGEGGELNPINKIAPKCKKKKKKKKKKNLVVRVAASLVFFLCTIDFIDSIANDNRWFLQFFLFIQTNYQPGIMHIEI